MKSAKQPKLLISSLLQNQKNFFILTYNSEKKYCYKRLFYIFQRIIRIKIIAKASNHHGSITLTLNLNFALQPATQFLRFSWTKMPLQVLQFLRLLIIFGAPKISHFIRLIFTLECTIIKLIIHQRVGGGYSDNYQTIICAVV